MKKTMLIIAREYLTRVRKKSFIVLTILVPLLIVGMYAAIFMFAIAGNRKLKEVTVLDESGVFENKFRNTENIRFSYSKASPGEAKERLLQQDDSFLLRIGPFRDIPQDVELISSKQAGIDLIETIDNQMERVLRDKKLTEAGIDTAVLNHLAADVSLSTTRLTKEGEAKTSAGASYGVALAACILIYLFIFLYGVQVMRGVIEEKTSRIVEVIISSVKPYQLMMGKILGIALVGLTQFLLWIALTLAATGVVKTVFADQVQAAVQQQTQVAAGGRMATEEGTSNQSGTPEDGGTEAGTTAQTNPALEVLQALGTLDLPLILGCFIFYFLGGYLLYSALFAAVGSAVDNETETQQFMFPVTIPLLFAYLSSFGLITNPDSSLLFWLSLIPFTSPVSMMVRLPFGVPAWQILLSMALLVGGFVFTVWLAARIYRTGILMYGKKVTFRELGKWLFYRN